MKLTRTLFIVPLVLIFSWVYAKKESTEKNKPKVNIVQIFPWFILGFLAVVAIRSTGLVPDLMVEQLTSLSKFFLAVALAAIGMQTSLKEVAGVGFKPMVAGVIIDTSVVIVALITQGLILRYL